MFYITTGSQDVAYDLARIALEEKLAGCANVFPIRSNFPWQGVVQEENEHVLILKTIPSLIEKLSSLIKKHHPYEVPCIMHWVVDVNLEYGNWITSNLSDQF